MAGLEEETKSFTDYRLNLAMDYGGLNEVARAIVKIGEATRKEKLLFEKILKNPHPKPRKKRKPTAPKQRGGLRLGAYINGGKPI